MPPESLEEVRLLSNLETGQHKLVNIMLFGQPELDELLTDRRLRQVRDRVVHRFKLMPLPPLDTSAYVDHRLRAAGWKGGALFSPAAMALLIKASGGRARRINLLADKALLATYALGLSVVHQQQMQDAIGELHQDFSTTAASSAAPWIKWAALSVGLAIGMTALSVWFLERQRESAVPVAVGKQEKAVSVPAAPAASEAAPVAERVAVAVPASAPASAPEATATVPAVEVASAPTPIPVTSTPAPAATAKAPVNPAWKHFLQRTDKLLRQPDLGGFTLQIATLARDSDASTYLNFVGHHVDFAVVYAQLTIYNNRDFVSVFVGRYATIDEAHAALDALPAPLKVNKPIVRTWVKIRQDQPP
jgi:MSHA biogenesis protein MshM